MGGAPEIAYNDGLHALNFRAILLAFFQETRHNDAK